VFLKSKTSATLRPRCDVAHCSWRLVKCALIALLLLLLPVLCAQLPHVMNVSALEGPCKQVMQMNTPTHATADTVHAACTAVSTHNRPHVSSQLLLLVMCAQLSACVQPAAAACAVCTAAACVQPAAAAAACAVCAAAACVQPAAAACAVCAAATCVQPAAAACAVCAAAACVQPPAPATHATRLPDDALHLLRNSAALCGCTLRTSRTAASLHAARHTQQPAVSRDTRHLWHKSAAQQLMNSLQRLSTRREPGVNGGSWLYIAYAILLLCRCCWWWHRYACVCCYVWPGPGQGASKVSHERHSCVATDTSEAHGGSCESTTVCETTDSTYWCGPTTAAAARAHRCCCCKGPLLLL
jgi:hypothetical protein